MEHIPSKKRLRVLDANTLYLIGAILFWTVGAYFQNRDLQSGLIITQYIVILLPPIIYIKIRGLSIKETLKLNKISFKHGFLVALITILTYPLAVFANAFLMTVMSFIGNLNIPALPTATNSSEYLILMFIISVSAGICEEVFFRGFVLSGYEGLGKRKAVLLSGILFGFFHFNLYNLMGPMVLGLVFGYLVLETKSIFAGVIGHMVNNGFAVTLGFLLNLASEMVPDMEAASEAAVELPTSIAMLISTITFGVISIITVFIAYQLIKIIKKDMAALNEESRIEMAPEEEQTKVKGFEFAPLILPGFLFIMIVIAQLKEIISLG